MDDLGFVDYFFGGLGTTGSSLGIATRLKENNPDFKAIGITAQTGHFIPGIRSMTQMMESTLFQKDYYDDIYPLSEHDALTGMMMLIKNCAVLCGPSSGANFTAALRHLQNEDKHLTTQRKAVFIVCDRMEWYISYIKERMPELFGEKEIPNSLYKFDSRDIDIVPEINPNQINQWILENPDSIIIDTRAAMSFDLIKIPKSMNMPQEQFEKWINGNNPFSNDTKILIICAVGERSRHFAAYLNTLGAKAYNLKGGIMAWADERMVA